MDQQVALQSNKLLITIAGIMAEQWEKFTGWLVTGIAATLALIIANADKTTALLQVASVKYAIKIFIAILVVHAVQRILAIAIASGVAGFEKFQKPDGAVLDQRQALEVIDTLEDAYFFPFSCMIHSMLRRVRKSELTHVGKRILRLALTSVLLAGVQVCLAVWAVWKIGNGLS